jgi:hypothetical protein
MARIRNPRMPEVRGARLPSAVLAERIAYALGPQCPLCGGEPDGDGYAHERSCVLGRKALSRP